MKLWKRGFAMALAAAVLLAVLTACGPSGPSTPEQPGSSGSSGTEQPGTGETGGETGKDPSETPGSTGTKDPDEKPEPEDPGKSGSEDENTKETEEQKAIKATVDALNAVRAEHGNKPLTLNADACALAKKMAQVQLDGQTGVYGSDPMTSKEYQKAWNDVTVYHVNKKSVVGIGGYGGYPNENVFRSWVTNAGKWKAPLVLSSETTLVGVGMVKNTDEKTCKEWPYMVVVMTY